MNPRVLNFQPSPIDRRDQIVVSSSSQVTENSQIDHSGMCTVVKDQGGMGSCSAFACVSLMEYVYRRSGISIPEDLLAERFLYYTTRVLIEKSSANEDNGAYMRDVLKAMQKHGVCLEKSMPYNMKFAEAPSRAAYREAMNYQIIRYATIPVDHKTPSKTLDDLKNLLTSGYTFVGGVVCYSNFFNDVKGNIPLPKGQIVGGHAVHFVGFDDVKKVFKFKNSWGTGWGDKGYGYLPYDFVYKLNLFDIWTVYTEEFRNKPTVDPNMSNRNEAAGRALVTALNALVSSGDLSNTPNIKSGWDQSFLRPSDMVHIYGAIDKMAAVVKQLRTAMKD